jgi:hypothetical protein
MKIEIGDTMFDFEYTVNSVCDLEEITKKNLAEVVSNNGFSSVRALLWCGLSEHMKGLTIAKAGNIMQEYLKTHPIEELMTIIGEAIEQAGFLGAQGKKKK